MSLAGNLPTSARLLQDGLLSVAKALPVAATTANTNGIDLGQATPWPVTEKVVVSIITTASAGSANSKNVNIVLQDSADNITFANVALLGNPLLRVTDSGGATPAGSANVTLPPSIKRYIRASALGEANGGNAADATVTLAINF